MVLLNSHINVDLSAPHFPLSFRSDEMTVFCDLDGPLIDVSARYYKTYRLAIAETLYHYQSHGMPLNLTPMGKKRFWHMKRERIPDPDIAARTGFMDEQIDFFLGTVKTLVNQSTLLRADRLQNGAATALGSLHDAGVNLALVTLREHNQAIQVLKRFGIYHYFSHIRGTHDEFAAYANYTDYKAAMLSDLMQKMSITERHPVCMIGDTEADVLSAKAVGIPAIALSCGMRSAEYLQRLEPTCILGCLQDTVPYVLQQQAA